MTIRTFWRRACSILAPLVLFLACVLAQGGCTCGPDLVIPERRPLLICRPHTPPRPAAAPIVPKVTTVSAGTIPHSFSITPTGGASLVMPLTAVPGRAGVEPDLALTYNSEAVSNDGILGAGFSITGPAAVTRCASTLAEDGEIRAVRYDAADKLCWGGQRMVVVASAPGTLEFRTKPDSFTKIVGHYASEVAKPGNALSFEIYLSSGLVIEAGTTGAGAPLAKGGAVRAWLAEKVHDGRGNTMTYDYCFAEDPDEGYTAEYALDEIRYTAFEGEPALPASRAVKLVYGTKHPSDIRTLYSGGSALQNSLRLDEIQMLGPEDKLVRRYAMTYDLSEKTHRTRLIQVEECAADGVCKPPMRFQFSSNEPGFEKIEADLPRPTAEKAVPMLLDLNADGLADLVVPDTDPALSTASNPITRWLVAKNHGPSAKAPYFAPLALGYSEEWPSMPEPVFSNDPAGLQPEMGAAIDYNHDGRMDILLYDVNDNLHTWHILITQQDGTFELQDTGIARPFPLRDIPKPPVMTTPDASMHLADLDGNGVPDLIHCEDHHTAISEDPSSPAWTLHLWKPAHDGTPAGFDPEAVPIDVFHDLPCNDEMHTVDLDADGKVDLVVVATLTFGDGTKTAAGDYSAVSRRADGTFEVWRTHLPLHGPRDDARTLFMDVNGDGLPDAVESGFDQGDLRVYLNHGGNFSQFPIPGLPPSISLTYDYGFPTAIPIDFNGDGRQDLLMSIPAEILPDGDSRAPLGVILEATTPQDPAAFRIVNVGLPAEISISSDHIATYLPRPSSSDLDGDGADDLLLTINGLGAIFRSKAADQDLLIGVSDGLNAHDPDDKGFVPNVAITYGHLGDWAMTEGLDPADPAREGMLYLSRADASNDCDYPRSCAVGPFRVASGYTLNNGSDGERRFALRYRDGRFDHRGPGFLGFGERITIDLDTGAGSADFYDNRTFDEDLASYPKLGQTVRAWHWAPALAAEPNPDKISLTFTDLDLTVTPTSEQKTFFTLPTHRRLRRMEGVLGSGSAEAFAAKVEATGAGATLLRDAHVDVTDFDLFGQVLKEDVMIEGVDLTFHVDRFFKNDTGRWVLSQLKYQEECSTAAMLTQCRTLDRTTTIYGEVESENIADGDGSPDVVLSTVYGRDLFGNVETITEDDAFGHHRVTTTTYEPEGIYPYQHTNAEKHISITEYDPAFGVMTKLTDPNQLATTWDYDGFGRLGKETRPDKTETIITSARAKKGGDWVTSERTSTAGGADDEVVLDGKGRVIQRFWHGPEPQKGTPRLMQKVVFDALGEHISGRSVPVREGTPEAELLFDAYVQDALGREIEHTTPWGLHIETVYDGSKVTVTDSAGHEVVSTLDPIGRPLDVIDAAKGATSYSYGPFGFLHTVTDPGGALTRMTRDVLGRVRQLDDPDRGTTVRGYDGFGELVSTTDALMRMNTYEYDGLGRPLSRTPQGPGASKATTWTWDTAAYGIGKLQALEGPDGTKTYTYNSRGKAETLTVAIDGQGETFTAKLDYDPLGRVSSITYPTPAGAPPFVVAQDYDAHGFLLAARDPASALTYWHLDEVDAAGRYHKEALGKEISTTRTYYADKQGLKSIFSQGSTILQDLTYDYDPHRNLKSRTDALQQQNPVERFRYDSLDRLTCAYFGMVENPGSPCATGYDYDPNGNLIFKSDVGALSYDDPAHPHAVTGAGGASYGYDVVGNQTSRPGGMVVTYTAFDLPATMTQGLSSFSFGYDGDEQRIRKTAPEEETLYFEGLYERVTSINAPVEHRYYVRSPERTVAIVTRGGMQPGTRYLLADHLGSTDVVAGEDGKLLERRSYDAFGQRRNPEWGKPPPAFSSALTSVGFTGHEADEDLGLVNMKGRIFDPKLGRFLTTDPLILSPLSGQAWNPYSYVMNNPLSLVDPSGFDSEEPRPRTGWISVESPTHVTVHGTPRPPPPPPQPKPDPDPEQLRAAVPPVDTSPTGITGPGTPQAENGTKPDWTQHPVVQVGGGILGGVFLGLVPFAGVGEQFADALGVLPDSTPEARFGLALGQMIGGAIATAGGLSGEVIGGITSATGFGAAIGVPAIAVSTAVVVGGVGNMAAGIRAMATLGSGSGKAPVHHVMTNKNPTSTDRGGPWTPRFEAMAKEAGMTLEDAANKVEVPGHQGPHPQQYHEAVFQRLQAATRGLSGDAYTRAFRAELEAIRTEAATPGSLLNNLLTRQ
ncbi:MAG: FG-GAP-like repeat-containing protein [Byssovorax sp.]